MKNIFDYNISRYPCSEEVEERRKAVAEIERLHDLVGSLAEDLRIALGMIEQQGGEVSKVWVRALKQNAEAAEQEVASFYEKPSCLEDPAVIDLREKKRRKRKRQKETLAHSHLEQLR